MALTPAIFTRPDGPPLCAVHLAIRCALTGDAHTYWDAIAPAGTAACGACEEEAALRRAAHD